MRRVPEYCIIGRGQMASHICHYFSLIDVHYCQWHRASATPLTQIVSDCPRILLLISDDAIEDFIRDNECLQDKTLIHFSGCLCTDLAYGVHPLMTFGPQLYKLSQYQSIPFVVEKEAPEFTKLFPALQNKSVRLAENQKPRYHSLCVLSGNFSTLLWEKTFTEMQTLGIERDLILPYLKQSYTNLLTGSHTLTGPLARGEKSTLEDNIQALEGDPYQQVYRAFVKAYQEAL